MISRRNLIASIPATLIPPGTKDNCSGDVIVNVTIPDELIRKIVQETLYACLHTPVTSGPVNTVQTGTTTYTDSCVKWNKK